MFSIFPFLVSFDFGDDLVGFPLRPNEVVLVPFFEVAHRPPETLLQTVPHEDRVVALTYVVLVGRECCLRERNYCVVRLIDLHQELSVVLLLILLVFVLIFGI